jgi:hypothetical protein
MRDPIIMVRCYSCAVLVSAAARALDHGTVPVLRGLKWAEILGQVAQADGTMGQDLPVGAV